MLGRLQAFGEAYSTPASRLDFRTSSTTSRLYLKGLYNNPVNVETLGG